MKYNININRKLFAPKFFPLLEDYSHRYEFYKGSAGSGKSYFITQKIVYRCLREPIKVLVCRRYGTTIRNSVFSLFKNIIEEWHLTPLVKIKESDFTITFANGSTIIFMGLDNEEKLLSLTDISTIFIEEIFEVPLPIYEQLNLRMRGKAKNQQIIAAFNPISKKHWLYDYCVVNPPENLLFSESTFRDNPFLSDEYISSIEDLKERNPQKYLVYGLGEWGVPTEGLVFQNWRVENFDALELASSGLEHRAGSDLGFVDPTTIIDTLYDAKAHKIYVFNEWFKSGAQLDVVAAQMEAMNLKRVKIYMDAAEPRSIQFFKTKGFNTVPCIKGAGSVKARIQFLQNNEIIIHPSCERLVEEFSNFSYIKNRDGEYTEDTTHEFSHGIDGLGYAYSDIYTKKKMTVLDKNLLGL